MGASKKRKCRMGCGEETVGTVKEIVFNKDEIPLDRTLPQYVIVDFPDYCGPPWVENKPTWVPIPQIEISRSNFFSIICFIPLSLAYAKTGHTFQGQSAGPDHAIKCIIIQPGLCSMEKLCPGLLYMFICRGSTIGKQGNRVTSSIFFIGDELTKERIKNLTKTKSGEICHKIKHRTKWIKYLKKNILHVDISQHNKKDLIRWATKTTVSKNTIKKIIQDDTWRMCDNINY